MIKWVKDIMDCRIIEEQEGLGKVGDVFISPFHSGSGVATTSSVTFFCCLLCNVTPI